MSSALPSWRPLLASNRGLFLVILAFLAGQLRAGGDPALGTSAAAQRTTEPEPPETSRLRNGSQRGPESDGFVPGGRRRRPPCPTARPRRSSAPTTHQS